MLFQKKNFISHNNLKLDFKIECDVLDNEDLKTLAYLISKKFKFKKVIGIPNGGLKIADKLKKYVENDEKLPILIIDDVLTTGKSMIEAKKDIKEDNIIGIVLFARKSLIRPLRTWIFPIFQMW